jgi:hypothetical protein
MLPNYQKIGNYCNKITCSEEVIFSGAAMKINKSDHTHLYISENFPVCGND